MSVRSVSIAVCGLLFGSFLYAAPVETIQVSSSINAGETTLTATIPGSASGEVVFEAAGREIGTASIHDGQARLTVPATLAVGGVTAVRSATSHLPETNTVSPVPALDPKVLAALALMLCVVAFVAMRR